MMATKMGATSRCGPEQARNRLDVAKQYQELAHLKAKEKIGAARNVAVGNERNNLRNQSMGVCDGRENKET